MAYLNGHQDHFTMVGGQESARGLVHLAELFRLADQARACCADPGRCGMLSACRRVLAVGGDRTEMADPARLSLNTITVCARNGRLAQCIELCARHGISPASGPGATRSPSMGVAARRAAYPRRRA